MREYGKVSPRFWIGATGRKIRALGPEAQVLALYLLTCPAASMTGVFYLPRPTMEHETGLDHDTMTTCIADLTIIGFFEYDHESEMVWVREMARHQIGDTLTPKDKRHAGVIKELRAHTGHRFVAAFWEHYRVAFSLPTGSPFPADTRQPEAPSHPDSTPSKQRAGAGERTGAGAGTREDADQDSDPGTEPAPTAPSQPIRPPSWEEEAMRLRTLSNGVLRVSGSPQQCADFGRFMDAAARQHQRSDLIELLARFAVDGKGFAFMADTGGCTMASLIKNDASFLFSSIERALGWEADQKPKAPPPVRIVQKSKPRTDAEQAAYLEQIRIAREERNRVA